MYIDVYILHITYLSIYPSIYLYPSVYLYSTYLGERGLCLGAECRREFDRENHEEVAVLEGGL